MTGDWHIGGLCIVEGPTIWGKEKWTNVWLVDGGRRSRKVRRLHECERGFWGARVPWPAVRPGRCPRGQGEVTVLGMSKPGRFGAEAILWLAGGSSVVDLRNCALRGFSLQGFCYSQLLESGWSGALGSARRAVSLRLRSPDWLQNGGHREGLLPRNWSLAKFILF